MGTDFYYSGELTFEPKNKDVKSLGVDLKSIPVGEYLRKYLMLDKLNIKIENNFYDIFPDDSLMDLKILYALFEKNFIIKAKFECTNNDNCSISYLYFDNGKYALYEEKKRYVTYSLKTNMEEPIKFEKEKVDTRTISDLYEVDIN